MPECIHERYNCPEALLELANLAEAPGGRHALLQASWVCHPVIRFGGTWHYGKIEKRFWPESCRKCSASNASNPTVLEWVTVCVVTSPPALTEGRSDPVIQPVTNALLSGKSSLLSR